MINISHFLLIIVSIKTTLNAKLISIFMEHFNPIMEVENDCLFLPKAAGSILSCFLFKA
jgi:hypothetical protein